MFACLESTYTRFRRLTRSTADTELTLLPSKTLQDGHQQIGPKNTHGKHAVGLQFNTEPRETKGRFTNVWNSIRSLWVRNPEVYKALKNSRQSNTKNQPFCRGWRKAVRAAAALTGVICLINLSFTISTVAKFPASRGVGQIYEGDCDVVKRYNIALHVLINVLSTLLFGASNYTMQCLSSPTRSEVDAAHAKGISLVIGLLNVKNFWHMHPRKGLLWLCLCLSSMPLHFLWNSTIFVTGASNRFGYLVIDETFFSDTPHLPPSYSACSASGADLQYFADFMFNLSLAGKFRNISAEDCFNKYNKVDGTKLRNLMLVTKPIESLGMSLCSYNHQVWNRTSIVAINYNMTQGQDWLLRDVPFYDFPFSTVDGLTPGNKDVKITDQIIKGRAQDLDQNHTWHFGQYPIQYCLSEQYSAPCKLQYASFILYTVVACNFIKLVCMLATMVYLWDLRDPILATVGDATSSFLDNKDKLTEGLCLMDFSTCQPSRLAVRCGDTSEHGNAISWKYRTAQCRDLSLYQQKPRSLCTTEPGLRVFVFFFSGVLFCTAGYIILVVVLNSSNLSEKLGTVNQNAILNIDGASGVGLFGAILSANSPQIVFSMVYVMYNTSLTARCATFEWVSYTKQKLTPLRVTWPIGHQKSTYFLQIPWRYGIPLIITQILMHFLISESVFLARLTYYDAYGNPTTGGFLSVGYSASGILGAAIVWTVMLLAILITSMVDIDSRIPIHGNKSVVISAVCQADDGANDIGEDNSEEKLSAKLLMWGVTRKPSEPDAWEEHGIVLESRPGHCTFSDKVVELPQQGLHYA